MAWSRLRSGALPEPFLIQQWPGLTPGVLEKKVATKIAYSPGRSGASAWGYEARASSITYVQQYFKLLLDRNIAKDDFKGDDLTEEEHHGQVVTWFENYLECLYKHIKENFTAEIERATEEVCTWGNIRVEFLFSFPTTWDLPVVKDYEKIIRRAGYGSVRGHSAEISISEAEAAAIYTAAPSNSSATDDGDIKPFVTYEVYCLLQYFHRRNISADQMAGFWLVGRRRVGRV